MLGRRWGFPEKDRNLESGGYKREVVSGRAVRVGVCDLCGGDLHHGRQDTDMAILSEN